MSLNSKNKGAGLKSKHANDKRKYEEDNNCEGSRLQNDTNPQEQEFNNCDKWDLDCKIIKTENIVKSLTGYHLMPSCNRNTEQPSKKFKVRPEMNPELLQENFTSELSNCWEKCTKLKNSCAELIVEPFKVCVIDNLIENCEILNKVREEFNEINWNERSMDLYEFFQSKDLKHNDSKYIKLVYEFLKTDVKKWVSELTNLELSDVSATCSLYSNTDYLLVHDDQREDRLIAFVLYLTSEGGWEESKGGALQLFSHNSVGHPDVPVRNVFPGNNQFVFFPVTNESYHQVAEITTREDCRLSINGWFHTSKVPKFQHPKYTVPEDGLYGNNFIIPQVMDIDLGMWIHEDYLNQKNFKIINKQIEENSEISLKNFFKSEPFIQIYDCLGLDCLTWDKVGPPNRHCYEVLSVENLPHILERFINLFQSDKMFKLLNNYTELELCSESASMKFEFQRWSGGCYSLLGDYNWEEKNELDVIIHFGIENESDFIGGIIQYVTMDDEVQNALISIVPEDNNLNIVFRDVARFTSYVSKQSKGKHFYTMFCSYSN